MLKSLLVPKTEKPAQLIGSVQFIDDRQLFQSPMLDQLLLVICVLISLKGAHYSTHFQVDLELLLLILSACESLEKTKSEIETIHKRGLGKDLTAIGEKRTSSGLQGGQAQCDSVPAVPAVSRKIKGLELWNASQDVGFFLCDYKHRVAEALH